MRKAALDAALAQLLQRGYEGLNIRDVADAAGIAETTVYRRWPTKAALAAAAIEQLAAADNPLPDTGTLEGDLRVLLGQILGVLRRPEIQRLVRAAVALADTPSVNQSSATFFAARFAGSAEVARRAIARGELARDTDAEAVIEHLVAPAYLRLLLTGRPLDAHLEQESVRRTLAAYRT